MEELAQKVAAGGPQALVLLQSQESNNQYHFLYPKYPEHLQFLQLVSFYSRKQITKPPVNNPLPKDKVTLNSAAEDFIQKIGGKQLEVANFVNLVATLINECSQSNIQAGTLWILENCTTIVHATSLSFFLYKICQLRETFSEMLHVVYLINDVLHHCSRKNLPWIKEGFLANLGLILNCAYMKCSTNEEREKLTRLINIWKERSYFSQQAINQLNGEMMGTPYSQSTPHPQNVNTFGPTHTNLSRPSTTNTTPVAPVLRKPYWELPASLMIPLINPEYPYAKIKASMIKEIPKPNIDEKLSAAVDEFYEGLIKQKEFFNNKESNLNNEPDKDRKSAKPRFDEEGWEIAARTRGHRVRRDLATVPIRDPVALDHHLAPLVLHHLHPVAGVETEVVRTKIGKEAFLAHHQIHRIMVEKEGKECAAEVRTDVLHGGIIMEEKKRMHQEE
ncbi:hypothetical protein HK098_002334 [Nowakowskiella sp. JEL0407]|nr:hypothetical protein HK098_002334 [Nowakowskiella sp. JEL0407]